MVSFLCSAKPRVVVSNLPTTAAAVLLFFVYIYLFFPMVGCVFISCFVFSGFRVFDPMLSFFVLWLVF